MQEKYSLHKITNSESFSFSPLEYSRFKFGDSMVAEQFGVDLAKGFIAQHAAVLLEGRQIVVFSSPYAFIPTATYAMKTFFVYELNNWLANHNLPVIEEAKVYRTVTYKEDYGELNADERIKLISNDRFYIDKNFLDNKLLLFLDDIRITGGHEKMIQKMIDLYQLKNDIFLLYFAELINVSIPPNIENYLNYFAVKSIFDLDGIVKSSGFAINTRIVKYILNSNTELFELFIQKYDIEFYKLLYNMAIGNSYHTIDAYKKNISHLSEHLQHAYKMQYFND